MVTSTALWAGWVQKPMGLEVFARSQADQGKYSGKVLAGKYLLTQTLGEGGEGVIYAGHLRYDPGQIFAFKVGYTAATEEFASDGLPNDPVLREHAVMKSIDSIFVPKVRESGLTSAGYPFSVRTLLPGLSLAKLLKRSPCSSFANALMIGTALCQAVRSIHEQGILHRDIKPGNIVIAPALDGDISLRLIDFAAGCTIEEEHTEEEKAPLGTPAYMAPERAKGKAAGKEGDLYSIGAILYELFTGKSILGPDSWNMETAHQILQSEAVIPAIPLREYRPDVPPEIGHAISRMVHRDPTQRNVNLDELESLLSMYIRKEQADSSWFSLPRRTTSQVTALPRESWFQTATRKISDWWNNR